MSSSSSSLVGSDRRVNDRLDRKLLEIYDFSARLEMVTKGGRGVKSAKITLECESVVYSVLR